MKYEKICVLIVEAFEGNELCDGSLTT